MKHTVQRIHEYDKLGAHSSYTQIIPRKVQIAVHGGIRIQKLVDFDRCRTNFIQGAPLFLRSQH